LPIDLFQDNRKRFLKAFKEEVKDLQAGSIMLLKGKEDVPVDSTGKAAHEE
jgi:hypothetical protein